MFNLLRMDLYRMKRGKSLYVCLGILLVMTMATLGMVWLMGTPQGQEVAMRMGILTAEEQAGEGGYQTVVMPDDVDDVMEGVDTLVMLRQTGMDGGMYNLIFGIWIMLFVCMDFQSGFIKNIMAVHQNRWSYVTSKVMTAGIVSIFYMAAQYALVLILNGLLGNMAPVTDFKDVLFYLSWAWLLTVAFAALVVMVCVWTRSVAAGALTVVLLSSGMVQGPLHVLLDLVHMGEWVDYTIYYTLDMGPGCYTALADLYAYGVGAGFLILYAAVAGMVLSKRDI